LTKMKTTKAAALTIQHYELCCPRCAFLCGHFKASGLSHVTLRIRCLRTSCRRWFILTWDGEILSAELSKKRVVVNSSDLC
jgi:hypothetical protein